MRAERENFLGNRNRKVTSSNWSNDHVPYPTEIILWTNIGDNEREAFRIKCLIIAQRCSMFFLLQTDFVKWPCKAFVQFCDDKELKYNWSYKSI